MDQHAIKLQARLVAIEFMIANLYRALSSAGVLTPATI